MANSKNVRSVIGEDNFKKLQREFAGKRIWIPKLGNLGVRDEEYYRRRNDQIRRMREAGFRIKNIALRFRISEKRVYNILTYDINET